jgi:xanthine dehydrogenase small subunit
MVNASPIGDLSALFLALNAHLKMDSGRQVALKEFFLDYKKTNLNKGELIQLIEIGIPSTSHHINFEKVSKRTYLDIASVNSACSVCLDGDLVNDIHLSLGGIAAYPLFMAKTCDFLKVKELNTENIKQALSVLQSEISPISDIRGSSKYKRQLSQQLFLNHFRKLYPDRFTDKDILELSTTKINAL